MKLITSKYCIYTDKTDHDFSLVNAADFHVSKIHDRRKFAAVKDGITELKPDYICIPGDYIDMPETLENASLYDESLSYIEGLSKISPVLFSIGSHEFMCLDGSEYFNEKWFSELNSIPNVHLLDNKKYSDGEIAFYGYTLPYDYYNNPNGFEYEGELIRDFQANMPSIEEGTYNILLCHSPMRILNDDVINGIPSLKNTDIVLSGHMHNGMLFAFMDKMIKGHKGLIAPNKSLFPDNTRGIICKEVDGKKIYLVITGGVTKIQEMAPRVLHFADKLYNPQMDYVRIKSLRK